MMVCLGIAMLTRGQNVSARTYVWTFGFHLYVGAYLRGGVQHVVDRMWWSCNTRIYYETLGWRPCLGWGVKAYGVGGAQPFGCVWKGSSNVSTMESSWGGLNTESDMEDGRLGSITIPLAHALCIDVAPQNFSLTHPQPWHSFTSTCTPPPLRSQHLTLHEKRPPPLLELEVLSAAVCFPHRNSLRLWAVPKHLLPGVKRRRGEGRGGKDGTCTCCSLHVRALYVLGKHTHTHMWANNYSNGCFVSCWTLY